MTNRCNIPARTLPPCDREWAHDGAWHSNAGDGFEAREYAEEHHRRQVERAKGNAPLSDAEARAMLLRLGLPVEACMAMRRTCAHGAKKYGCRPGESAKGWRAVDHIDHAYDHLDLTGSDGTEDCDGPASVDEDTGELNLAHAMTRLALAIEVLCG